MTVGVRRYGALTVMSAVADIGMMSFVRDIKPPPMDEIFSNLHLMHSAIGCHAH